MVVEDIFVFHCVPARSISGFYCEFIFIATLGSSIFGGQKRSYKAISNALDEPIFATSLDTVCTHEVSFELSMCPSKICSTLLLRILLPYAYSISVISQPILFEFWFIKPIIGLAFSLGTTVPDQS